MSELGSEGQKGVFQAGKLQRDIPGREHPVLQKQNQLVLFRELWLTGENEGGDGRVWMRQAGARSSWSSHCKGDSQDKVFSERSLFCFLM